MVATLTKPIPKPEEGEYVAVVGSRNFPAHVVLAWFEQNAHWVGKVVSGECPGSPDMVAKLEAKRRGIRYLGLPLQRDGSRGNTYAHNRNSAIVAAVGRVVAFHDSFSNGTQNIIDIACSRGKIVNVYGPDGKLTFAQGAM